MVARLVSVCFDSVEPAGLARFWSGLLGWPVVDDQQEAMTLTPHDDTGFSIRFLPSAVAKLGPNTMHFDLTSASVSAQEQTVATALELGARHIDVGQRPEDGHVVLADPEGNEFCVIEAGNAFLADCGFIGALSCDGSQDEGYFWSHALGWPLVWDQDQETAIRSPHGGPKITWGGLPFAPITGRARVHLDIAPSVPGDQLAEVERLVSLGAARVDPGQRDASRVVMADVDGRQFCVLPR